MNHIQGEVAGKSVWHVYREILLHTFVKDSPRIERYLNYYICLNIKFEHEKEGILIMNKFKKLLSLVVICFFVLAIQFTYGATVINAATRDITTYGATPNDTTDDTAAINSAITAAVSGDTVYFPNGTFIVKNMITAKTGVKLIGQSQAGSILKYNSTTSIDGMIMIEGKSNIEIKYLTINGNSKAKLVNGIYANDSSGLLIHFVTVQNLTNPGTDDFGPHGIYFDGDGSTFNNGVVDSEISDSTFNTIGVSSEWGSGIRCSWGSKRNKILRNTISNTGRGGIHCNDGSSDAIIQNNTVTECGKWSGDTGEGLGIELIADCNNSIIENNNIDHWLSLDTSSKCAIRRNTISDTSGSDIKWCALEAAGACNDNVYTDNTVNNGTQVGISVSNVADSGTYKRYVYWGYNVVQNCVQWGAQLEGDTDGLTKHYFYNDQFLTTQNSNPGAEYPTDDGNGVRLNGNVKYVTFDKCKVNSNKALGYELVGSGVDFISIVGGEIKTNLGNAFSSFSGYTQFEVTGVTISGNANNSTPTIKAFTNTKPIASMTAPSTGTVGQVLSFISTSTDPGGSIAHVLWDFNDGIPSSTATQSHTFTKVGTYRVALVVWDNLGRGAIVEKTVTIN